MKEKNDNLENKSTENINNQAYEEFKNHKKIERKIEFFRIINWFVMQYIKFLYPDLVINIWDFLNSINIFL